MKIFRRLCLSLLAIALLLAGSFFFLGFSEPGFALLLKSAARFSDGVFTVEKVEGSFRRDISLHTMKIHTAAVDITLGEFLFSWQPKALFKKNLRVINLKAKNVELVMREGTKPEEDKAPLTLPDLFLPIAIILENIVIEDIALFSSGAENPLLIDSTLLKMSAAENLLHIKNFSLKSPGYEGELRGSIQMSEKWPLAIQGSYAFSVRDAAAVKGKLELNGNTDSVSFSTAIQEPAEITFQGNILQLLEDLHWQLQVQTKKMQLQQFNESWPHMDVSTLLAAEGNLETYQVEAHADIQWQDHQPVSLDTTVQGDPSGLEISSLALHLPEGSIQAAGQLGWQQKIFWQIELIANELNPGIFFPEWPGIINGAVKTNGEIAGEQLAGDLQIRKLKGYLRGYPVNGTGVAHVNGQNILIDKLQLNSGDSHLRVTGSVTNKIDLQFQADSSDLASLLPESSGRINLHGTVSGARETPKLFCSIDGSLLRYQNYGISALSGSAGIDFSSKGILNIDLNGEKIQIEEHVLRHGRLKLDGTMEEHDLKLDIRSRIGNAEIALTGGTLEKQWRGKIAEFLITSKKFGSWKLTDQVPMVAGSEKIELANFCISREGANLCTKGKWKNNGKWGIEARIDPFDLDLLNEWELIAPALTGQATLGIHASGTNESIHSADIVLELPEISLTVDDEDGQSMSYQWNATKLKADLKNTEIQLAAHTSFQDGSIADLNAKISDYTDFTTIQDLPFTGQLNIEFNDLKPLAPLSGYVVKPSGTLSGTTVLQGTIAQPEFSGEFVLKNGDITIPAAGISLKDVDVNLAGREKTINIKLDAHSGEGALSMKGIAQQSPENEWEFTAAVNGEDFTAVNLPEYTATVSPDLYLHYSDKETKIRGTVTVPKAMIAPNEFSSSVSPSKDVVIINAKGQTSEHDYPLELEVAVHCGEDVQIDTFGIKGLLGGSLTVRDKPGQAITGLGSLELQNGTFSFNNKVLAIRRGRIYYQGGPIDNPGIDVRAERKIKSNIYGIQVGGMASEITMNLYSIPPMDDSDILANILIGRDMSQSSEEESSMLGVAATTLGISSSSALINTLKETSGLDDVRLESGSSPSDVSLVIGKEVYENLYISYGHDLMNSAGIFKVRYDMDYGFSVQTETSSEATGADLLWAIER